jgi:hypothetical protein
MPTAFKICSVNRIEIGDIKWHGGVLIDKRIKDSKKMSPTVNTCTFHLGKRQCSEVRVLKKVIIISKESVFQQTFIYLVTLSRRNPFNIKYHVKKKYRGVLVIHLCKIKRPWGPSY